MLICCEVHYSWHLGDWGWVTGSVRPNLQFYFGIATTVAEIIISTECRSITRPFPTANSPEIYATRYTYDTYNRLRELVYPDGEVLTYSYNTGG